MKLNIPKWNKFLKLEFQYIQGIFNFHKIRTNGQFSLIRQIRQINKLDKIGKFVNSAWISENLNCIILRKDSSWIGLRDDSRRGFIDPWDGPYYVLSLQLDGFLMKRKPLLRRFWLCIMHGWFPMFYSMDFAVDKLAQLVRLLMSVFTLDDTMPRFPRYPRLHNPFYYPVMDNITVLSDIIDGVMVTSWGDILCNVHHQPRMLFSDLCSVTPVTMMVPSWWQLHHTCSHCGNWIWK